MIFVAERMGKRFFRRKRKNLKGLSQIGYKINSAHYHIKLPYLHIISPLFDTIFSPNNFIKNGPATIHLLIPQTSPQQSNLVYPSLSSQSYNAYESLYHLGKKEYFNTNSILRDQYSQRINLYSPNYSNPYQREEQAPQKVRESENVGILPLTNAQRYGETAVNTDNKLTRSHSNYSQRSKSSL